MNKMKRVISWVLICAMIFSFASISYAVDSETVTPQDSESSTESIPSIKEARVYAEASARDHISTFLILSSVGYAPSLNSEAGRFYLGNGYYTYTFDDEKLVRNEVISFPIIQSGKIVLQLNVSEADETWGGTGTTQFVDELNENIGINDTPIIVYYEKNGYLVKGKELICFNSAVGKEDQLQYETIESALLEILESSTDALNLESSLTELGYVENPVSNEPASTQSVAGFAMNTSTCKLLEIADCTVDQDCYVAGDAEYYQLCWAATAVTIARYRSGGYRTLRPSEVADYLNKGYFLGGDQTDVYNALEHYLNEQELDSYEALSRPASSFLEIQHNINNCFPIAMGCTQYLLGFIPMGGHMVTIIGYDGQQLIYWNSLTCKIETTSYKDGKTYIRTDGLKYKWDVSVLISL